MNLKRLFLAAAVALAGVLPANALELPAIGDVSIRLNSPGVNYGLSPSLEVNPNTVTYLRFAVPPLSVFGASGFVAYAELRLYVNRVLTPGTVSVFRMSATAAWDENTVSTPIPGAILAANLGNQPVNAAGTLLAFSIPVLVDSLIQSQTPLQLAVVTTDANILLDSRESIATSHGPAVEAVLSNSGPKGDTGATGATGAQGPQGGTGPAGADGLVRISEWQSNTQSMTANSQLVLKTSCPANFPRILSGGCDTQGGVKMRVQSMGPEFTTGVAERWTCTLANDTLATRTAVTWARCTVD